MKSEYHLYALIIFSYGLLAIVAEILIKLEVIAMQAALNGFLEDSIFLIMAPLMALVGYAAVKTIKLTD
ncbi:hypothetical protein [Methanococcoides sp. FTZ1]|uniref:hypothetical protein n=1 Tax=Methanococcoides sp. FTZ1 TaxID=3439061 RepID=UPI003F839E66